MTALDWVHVTTDIPEAGRRFERNASEAERRAIATELELADCPRLAADYTVRPLPGGRYRLEGTLSAEVVQPCVVTLEPVRQAIKEQIDVTFWPAANLPDAGSSEREILSEPEIEPLEDGRIAAGRVLFECLAAAIDPYPRAEGAEFDWKDPESDKAGAAGPFASLSKLKDKT